MDTATQVQIQDETVGISQGHNNIEKVRNQIILPLAISKW